MVHRPGQRRVTLVSSITDGIQEAAQKRSAAHTLRTAAQALRQVEWRTARPARIQSKKAPAGALRMQAFRVCVLNNYNLKCINRVIVNMDGNPQRLSAQPCAHTPEGILLAVHRRRGGRAAAGSEDGSGLAEHGANARARQTAQRARDHISTAGEDVRQGTLLCLSCSPAVSKLGDM